MGQRQLKDWAVIATNANASIRLRVFNYKDAMAGVFDVTVPQASAMIDACVWSGTGFSADYKSAEVISITNGPVYADPVKAAATLTTVNGQQLVANFDMGNVPLDGKSNPRPSL